MIKTNPTAVTPNGTTEAYNADRQQQGGAAPCKCTTPETDLLAAVDAVNGDPSAHPDSETARLLELLTAARIDPNEAIEATDYLFSWEGVDIMPRQNIVSLKAPAKTGKTFALTAFSTAFLKGEFGGLRCFASSTEKLLFVDTEQARNSTRKVLHRILKQAPGTETRIEMFNVRKYETKDRLPMIALAVGQCRPSLIIIDGIADLIPGMDYNDQAAADSVITALAALAEDNDAVVMTAIHTNKGDATAATGWLGRTLLQKCSDEIGLTRKAGGNTRTLEFVTRDREITPMTVAIEETEDKMGEIRIISSAEANEAEADKKRSEFRMKLLEIGIERPQRMTRPEFVRLVMDKKTQIEGNPYKRNAAEKFVARCIDAGTLTIDGDMYVFDY